MAMSLLDRIRDQIDKSAEAIGTAAARQSEILRLRRQVGELKERVDSHTRAAGRRALEMQEAGELTDAAVAEAGAQVKDAQAQMAELEAALQQLQPKAGAPQEGATRQCPKCGAVVPATSAFCSGCGASFPRCPNCGAIASADDRFCAGCGAPLAQAEAGGTSQQQAQGDVPTAGAPPAEPQEPPQSASQ
jgi:hypothetical protein